MSKYFTQYNETFFGKFHVVVNIVKIIQMKTLSIVIFFLFLLFFLLAGLFSAVKAQNWSIGDKVMIGHSWTVGNRNSNDLKYTFHPSLQVGRSAIYNFNSHVGVGLGTFFSTEGVTFKVANNTSAKKAEQRMNYIRIPVGAIFTLGDPASRVRPRLGVGGAVGFLVGGKTFAMSDDDAFIGLKTTKAMGTKIDAGATGSVGLSVRISDGFFVNHDINYYHGLVENKYESNLPSFTHRNIGLSMGFSLTGDAMRNWKGKMMHKQHHR